MISDTFMCFMGAETIIDVSIVECKEEQAVWVHYNKVKIIFTHDDVLTPSQRTCQFEIELEAVCAAPERVKFLPSLRIL